MSSGQTISDAELLEKHVRRGLLDAHVAMVCKVAAVNDNGTVDVKPLLKRPTKTVEGEHAPEPLQVIRSVPVAAFQAAGAMSESWPVAVDDFALVVFLDYSADGWKVDGQEVDPQDRRAHHLTDAVVVAFGPRPLGKPLQSIGGAGYSIGVDGGDRLEVLPDGTINLGQSAVAIAIAQKVEARLAEIVGKIRAAALAAPTSFTDAGVGFAAQLLLQFAAWPLTGSTGSDHVNARP